MNLFDAFEQYTEDGEPPKGFILWSAIGAVSAALGKKCYIPQGFFTVFPNLYIVLVGTPGSRKSTAMNIAKSLLRTLDVDFPVAPESTTREGLLEFMQEHPMEYELFTKRLKYHQAAAFASELKDFVGEKHINRAMVTIMTALWDEPRFEYKTRNGKLIKIEQPYLTLVGCCVPEWISAQMKADVISDGFTRRTIFCLGQGINKECPWPTRTPKMVHAWNTMKQEIRRIHGLAGEFTVSKPAYDIFEAFYCAIRKKEENSSSLMQHYYSSKHILVLKVSMCLTAVVTQKRFITGGAIRAALALLNEVEQDLENIFAGVGRNELKEFTHKVHSYIDKHGPVTKRTLLRHFIADLNSVEFQEVLQNLEEMGHVKIESGSIGDSPKYQAVARVVRDSVQDPFELVRREEFDLGESPLSQAYLEELPVDLDPAPSEQKKEQKMLDLKQGKLLRGKPLVAGPGVSKQAGQAADTLGVKIAELL